jgi:ribonuclease HI
VTEIFCDSSLSEYCLVAPNLDPIVCPYFEPVTVNVGEYKAVIAALELAYKSFGREEVEILSDSKLVVNQINGEWECRKEHLKELLKIARSLKDMTGAKLSWISREQNLAGKVLEC